MKLFEKIEDFKWEELKGSSIAIGNFDGIHPGHQKIIETTVAEGLKFGLPSGIFTFKRHPLNILHESHPVETLLTIPQKLSLFSELGLSFCMLADVSRDFFNISAEGFVRDILVGHFKVKIIVVGENFHFGKNAAASALDLKQMEKRFGFKVKTIPLLEFQNESISSSRIRTALKKHQFDQVNRLLNRQIFYTAKVVQGHQIGRKLGFPTANLSAPCLQELTEGIYVIRAWVEKNRHSGVLYIGKRPTFENQGHCIYEAHLFDYTDSVSLYGKEITIEPLHKIRNDRKFPTTEELVEQISKDVTQAKNMLKEWGINAMNPTIDA